MENRICGHCGKEVPANSRFCNHCGAPMPQPVVCAYCGGEIPAQSRFCPLCGRQLPAAEPDVPVQTNNDSQGWDFNKEDEEEQKVKASGMGVTAPSSAYTDEPVPKRRNNGPLVAAIITALILIVLGYFFFQGRADADRADVDTVEVPISADEAREILRNTLNSENRLGDLANVAFAIAVNPSKTGEKQIAGVSYYSSSSNRSFFKVYTITQDSLTSTWRVTYELNRTVDKHWLTFKPEDVMGENAEMPQHVTEIRGKDYMFFAYGAMPQVGETEGEVVMCLYDAQTSELIAVPFKGEIVQRDGKQLVYGKAENLRRSAETEYLVNQSQTAALIYHPTPEELELEKAENATRKWAVENVDNITALSEGGMDVRMFISVYDKPIFSLGDTEDGARIENENLIIVADDKGAVFGFSKTKRRYFVVYAPAEPTMSRSSVHFTDDGMVYVSAGALEFVFNPRNCTASAVSSLE
ncbi:MAG: zinc ribbon domain-containing protein [Muribaculaceae bacterium]